ncbi:hypothetical protein [Polaribacter sp. AHE13PA]|jgi:hypothetical protein|uniref:hypothetical protein n=1 Tax=Polaribacter sp. AHE13PA TaxID=2745562 RepID=UPI001C4F2972|nr:hypothetical protein [Polaribacter sp. AHE13PA]QXP68527.1 hypothetical protein H0I28_08595 [Polaribacter sp. AHE13PA]
MKTKELFDKIINGIELNSGETLEWNAELKTLIPYSNKHFIDNEYITLDFGIQELVNGIKIKLTVTEILNENKYFTNIGSSLKSQEETLSLIGKLKSKLGDPNEFYQGNFGIFTHWENNDNRIEIITKDHHGGSWFEFHIKKKISL